MHQRTINPWRWQDEFGFSQAIEVSDGRRMLVCSGQTAVDEEGHPVHGGDMVGQLNQAMDNLETVLDNAGYRLSDVVRLNVYTTDVDEFLGAYATFAKRTEEIGMSSTLLGVTRLALPELLLELEATAVA